MQVNSCYGPALVTMAEILRARGIESKTETYYFKEPTFLAIMFFENGQLEKAALYAEQARQFYSSDLIQFPIYYKLRLAQYLIQNHERKKAYIIMREALRMDPNSQQSHFLLYKLTFAKALEVP